LANEVTARPSAPLAQEAPHLRRVLGRWDLVLLFVVAVFNLNVVPSIAANGGVTVWLWIISLALFFGRRVSPWLSSRIAIPAKAACTCGPRKFSATSMVSSPAGATGPTT